MPCVRRRVVLALLSVAALWAAPHAYGAELETLLMPGKLITAHAKLEQDCTACHDRADRGRQTELCLTCHKEVAGDVRAKAGFHGRLANVSTGQCRACHSDHLGRDADIVKLDAVLFDHRATDFSLEGAHRALSCVSCHQSKPYRAATSQCGDCHRKDDVHQRQLGEKCGTCHGSATWAGGRLDHDKTAFPLRDAHRELSCDSCHIGGKYSGISNRCVTCHMPDDVHLGSRGDKCADCHTTVEWKTAKFDHARETGFALAGTHARVTCAGCHTSGKLEDALPRDCVGCHRADDAHALRFGDKCSTCHSEEAWEPARFDHATTKFALEGAHADIDCHACHTAVSTTQKLPFDCASCHRGDDVHGGKLTAGCDSCHGLVAWKKDIHFDHDLTEFPLLGMHVLGDCAQCHTSKAFKGAEHECASCHTADDVHKGNLGRDCAACHSPNGWSVWEFDHGKQTDFPLTGAHSRLNCADCHRRPASEVKLPKDCGSCHRKDDIHLGQFSNQCQRCHTTLTFKGARIQ